MTTICEVVPHDDGPDPAAVKAIEEFQLVYGQYLCARYRYEMPVSDDDPDSALDEPREELERALEAIMRAQITCFWQFWIKWRLFKEELDHEREVGERFDNRWIRFHAYIEADLRGLEQSGR